MSFTEDRSVFFSTSDFADVGTYDGSTSVNGILDDEYVEVFQGPLAGVSSSKPTFRYNADDITNPTVGVTLLVGGVNYIVRDVEQDRNLGRLILESTGIITPPPSATGVFSVDFSADFD